MNTIECPLCARAAAERVTSREERDRDILGYDCPGCGQFAITDDALAVLRLVPNLWIASAESRTRAVRNAASPLFVDSPEAEGLTLPRRATISLVRLCGAQPDIRSRLDRALVNLSYAAGSPGRHVEINSERDRALFWAHDVEFVGFVLDSMNQEAFTLQRDNPVRLSSKGWLRAEELRGGLARTGRTAQAFVAMWFDPTMVQAYEEAIAPAIQEAGFEPVRVDRKEHNNRIDDEIIALVRASAFLVAEFTGHRAGVYYEAGFAHGLGRPVILCVRDDHLDGLHFDLRQYSHITWGTPDQLRTRLLNRILATVGKAK